MENGCSEIQLFYQYRYDENGRMACNPLEFLRCKEIISRYLRFPNMEIADIGGATGAFSYWLARMNHAVHLLDLTPSHIERAKQNGKEIGTVLASYVCADARRLPYPDERFDLVLEMGPLYHLQARRDRMSCLSEALRVLKHDGVMICEVISRHVNLFEGFQDSLIDDARFVDLLDENLRSGNHSPGDTPYFTTAFFHTHEEIYRELEQAGFADISIIAVEGFANVLNAGELLRDGRRRELLMQYIRRTESVPELFGVSGHLIAVGRK